MNNGRDQDDRGAGGKAPRQAKTKSQHQEAEHDSNNTPAPASVGIFSRLLAFGSAASKSVTRPASTSPPEGGGNQGESAQVATASAAEADGLLNGPSTSQHAPQLKGPQSGTYAHPVQPAPLPPTGASALPTASTNGLTSANGKPSLSFIRSEIEPLIKDWQPSQLESLKQFLQVTDPNIRPLRPQLHPTAELTLVSTEPPQLFDGLRSLLRSGPTGVAPPATWQSRQPERPQLLQGWGEEAADKATPWGTRERKPAPVAPSSQRYAPYTISRPATTSRPGRPPVQGHKLPLSRPPLPAVPASTAVHRPPLPPPRFAPGNYAAPSAAAAPLAAATTPAETLAPTLQPALGINAAPDTAARAALANSARASTGAVTQQPAAPLFPNPGRYTGTPLPGHGAGRVAQPFNAAAVASLKRSREAAGEDAVPENAIRSLAEYKKKKLGPALSYQKRPAIGTPRALTPMGASSGLRMGLPGSTATPSDAQVPAANTAVTPPSATLILETLDAAAAARTANAGATPGGFRTPGTTGAPMTQYAGATPHPFAAPPLGRLGQTPLADSIRGGVPSLHGTSRMTGPTPSVLGGPSYQTPSGSSLPDADGRRKLSYGSKSNTPEKQTPSARPPSIDISEANVPDEAPLGFASPLPIPSSPVAASAFGAQGTLFASAASTAAATPTLGLGTSNPFATGAATSIQPFNLGAVSPRPAATTLAGSAPQPLFSSADRAADTSAVQGYSFNLNRDPRVAEVKRAISDASSTEPAQPTTYNFKLNNTQLAPLQPTLADQLTPAVASTPLPTPLVAAVPSSVDNEVLQAAAVPLPEDEEEEAAPQPAATTPMADKVAVVGPPAFFTRVTEVKSVGSAGRQAADNTQKKDEVTSPFPLSFGTPGSTMPVSSGATEPANFSFPTASAPGSTPAMATLPSLFPTSTSFGFGKSDASSASAPVTASTAAAPVFPFGKSHTDAAPTTGATSTAGATATGAATPLGTNSTPSVSLFSFGAGPTTSGPASSPASALSFTFGASQPSEGERATPTLIAVTKPAAGSQQPASAVLDVFKPTPESQQSAPSLFTAPASSAAVATSSAPAVSSSPFPSLLSFPAPAVTAEPASTTPAAFTPPASADTAAAANTSVSTPFTTSATTFPAPATFGNSVTFGQAPSTATATTPAAPAASAGFGFTFGQLGPTPAASTPTATAPTASTAEASPMTISPTNADVNDKITAPTSASIAFGTTFTQQPPTNTTTSPFGATQSTQPVSGTSSSVVTFGTDSAAPAFGTATTTAAAPAPTFGFGASDKLADTTSFPPTAASTGTGGTGFPASSIPNFAAPSNNPPFGTTATTAPAFGSAPAAAPSFGALGTTSATPAFNMLPPAASGPSFGSSAAPNFGGTSGPDFGASSFQAFAPPATAFTFGSQQAATPAPAQAPAATAPSFGFGGSAPGSAFGFGSSTAGTTPAFGQSQPAFTATAAFGAPAQASSVFGGPAQPFGQSQPVTGAPPPFAAQPTAPSGLGTGGWAPPPTMGDSGGGGGGGFTMGAVGEQQGGGIAGRRKVVPKRKH